MLQAALSDRQFLDLLPFSQNGFVPSKVDVGGSDVVQALVVALVVVVVDEGPDLSLEITGQVVILQQNTVLHGLVPAFDFALGLWVEWRPANVVHFLIGQPFGQIARDIAGAVVAEQTGFVSDHGLVAARCLKRQLDRAGHILGPHVRAELPGDDVAAVVVEDGGQVIPAQPMILK